MVYCESSTPHLSVSGFCNLVEQESDCSYEFDSKEINRISRINFILFDQEDESNVSIVFTNGRTQKAVYCFINSIRTNCEDIKLPGNFVDPNSVYVNRRSLLSIDLHNSSGSRHSVSILQIVCYFLSSMLFCFPKSNQFYLILLFGVLCIFTVPAYGDTNEQCQTLGISISNITDCTGSVCTAHFSNTGVGVLDQNYFSCMTVQELVRDDNVTIIPTHNITVNVMDAEYKFPIELKKIGVEVSITYNSYCEKSLIGNTLANCDLAPLTGYFPINFCHITKQYQRDNVFPGWRDVAINIGLSVRPRFNHYLVTRSPALQSAVAFTHDNISDVKDWSLTAPIEFAVGNAIDLDLYSANYMPAPVFGKNLVLDTWAPYDLYEVTNINPVGEHKNELYDAIHYLPNGTLLYNIEKIKEALTVKLLKCEDAKTRVQVDLPYADTDVNLENQRLAKSGLRAQYPSMRFYNEGSYRFNDQYSSSTSFTHNVDTPSPSLEYPKTGPTSISNYTTALLKGGLPLSFGYTDSGTCIQSWGDDIWQTTPGTLFQMEACDNGTNYWIACHGSYLRWVKGTDPNNINSWPVGATIDLVAPNGECYAFEFSSNPRNFTDIYGVGDNHLIFPFEEPGSYQFSLKGSFTGTFFTAKICPEIIKVQDNSTLRKIYLTVKSTCGNGNAIIGSSNSLSFKSKSIQLTDTAQVFSFDRIGNISGPITISVCSPDCVYKTIKLKTFPTNIVVDEVEEDDTEATPQFHLDTQNFWHPGNFLGGFGNFSIGHKILAVLYMIGYVILCLIVFLVVLWIGFKIIGKLVSTNWKMTLKPLKIFRHDPKSEVKEIVDRYMKMKNT